LSKSLAEKAHAGSNDWIICSIVVRFPPKDLNPNDALFESVILAPNRFLHDVSKQGLQLQTIPEPGTAQDSTYRLINIRRLEM
jgi:hypothetical protein